ncbi:hypothetical protein [Undibacterium oligocarboniphilum]|uniref:Uncharacterized protein n=1 Tax=Undibacterium oligocarboniphilum TaxID=666702 RepID=A0A850QII5_9BURK|nr:hypothetical protein [Undibacterium oligocarboniphilum]MBC3871745.1 hypothetical protein [Undibacterium oligocarboniphilum]NVO79381.1 hypothetical protein [Undibacterium oligocarboniphilum]
MKSVKTNHIPDEIKNAAIQYGFHIEYSASEACEMLLRSSDSKPLLGLEIKKNRLRVFSPTTKNLLFSGSVTAAAIGNFLENFFYARKVQQN